MELPPFELRPEGILDRMGEAFVHNDIDFDSHPEFSKRYQLRSRDQASTRRLFTPSLLTYVEQIPPEEKWHIEAAARTLIVYRRRATGEGADLPSFLDNTSAIKRTIVSSGGLKNSMT
jgi:hypothetical protein